MKKLFFKGPKPTPAPPTPAPTPPPRSEYISVKHCIVLQLLVCFFKKKKTKEEQKLTSIKINYNIINKIQIYQLVGQARIKESILGLQPPDMAAMLVVNTVISKNLYENDFSSQRSEMLLFLTTDMAAATSCTNQQYRKKDLNTKFFLFPLKFAELALTSDFSLMDLGKLVQQRSCVSFNTLKKQ